MRLRYKLGATGIILGSVFLWGKCSKNKPISPDLPPGVVEHITINPNNHTITITNQNGTHTTTLPPNTTTIDVGVNGVTVVKAPQFGVEVKPFLGWGYSTEGSVVLGVDFLYFKKLDLGGAFYGGATAVKPALTLSYNVWSNTRLTASINPIGTPGVFVTVRF
jgi:ribosomal protein L6P/L9E